MTTRHDESQTDRRGLISTLRNTVAGKRSAHGKRQNPRVFPDEFVRLGGQPLDQPGLRRLARAIDGFPGIGLFVVKLPRDDRSRSDLAPFNVTILRGAK